MKPPEVKLIQIKESAFLPQASFFNWWLEYGFNRCQDNGMIWTGAHRLRTILRN
jgi:hypothetical protein